MPLSTTLDHAGPLALCVQDAAWIWQVMAGRAAGIIAPAQPRGLRLTRLTGYFDAPVEAVVRTAFVSALEKLADAFAIFRSGRR